MVVDNKKVLSYISLSQLSTKHSIITSKPIKPFNFFVFSGYMTIKPFKPSPIMSRMVSPVYSSSHCLCESTSRKLLSFFVKTSIYKRAGIKKKITSHNARHSFGTNLIFQSADVTTASSLLGHSSLKHTQRYIKTAAELKQKAPDNLNINL